MSHLRRIAVSVWLPTLILTVWWGVSRNSTSAYFPPLSLIAQTFLDTWFWDRFQTDLMPSVYRFLTGFALAIALGVAIGVLLGLNRTLRLLTEPLVDFFRALPKPALVPVAILALGIGDGMQIALITFGAFWAVLLNTIDGVRGTDPQYFDVARSYGLSWGTRIRKIVLPNAAPQIFAGARLALAIALILMVISEMAGSVNGIGYFVLLSQQTFAIPQMWAGIILLGLIGYLSNAVFVMVEHLVLAWHRGWRGKLADAS
jgi:sulfonate transport system permease protein